MSSAAAPPNRATIDRSHSGPPARPGLGRLRAGNRYTTPAAPDAPWRCSRALPAGSRLRSLSASYSGYERPYPPRQGADRGATESRHRRGSVSAITAHKEHQGRVGEAGAAASQARTIAATESAGRAEHGCCTYARHEAAAQVIFVKDIIFNALGIILFGALLYLVLNDKSTASATVIALAAVFCATVGNLGRFSSLRFSLRGIEARAREVIHQAEVTQKEFQKLAAITGQLLIELNAAQGRLAGSGTGTERDKRKADILAALKEFKLAKKVMSDIAASDQQWNKIDYVLGITSVMYRDVPQDRYNEFQEDVSPFRSDANRQASTTAEDLKGLAEKYEILNSQIRGLVEDFAHYLTTGRQRRPEVWGQRYHWHHQKP